MKEIVLDLYGGDNSIESMFAGLFRALVQYKELMITIILKTEDEAAFIREKARFETENNTELSSRIKIVSGSYKVMTNYDNPVLAAASGADYTVTEAVKYLKSCNEDSWLISVGNTAAVLILSLSVIGLNAGVTKPVLASLLPREDGGKMCVLDCGANLEPTAEEMAAFASVGNDFVKKAYGVEKPKIALLSVGKEKGKGTPKIKNAYRLLEESELNFIGNAEPDDLLVTDIDVLVCDGLSGNIVLKNIEAAGKYLRKCFEKSIENGDYSRDVIESIKMEWNRLEKSYSFNDYGGAVMVGIKRNIIKAHGKANSDTVFHCIGQAMAAGSEKCHTIQQ